MSFNLELARAIGLTRDEIAVFRKLKTPEKIQDFLTAMPINFEPAGDTCLSVRMALRENRCHCIEAAFIAACALLLHGERALLMDFQASGGDDDHVLALFKRGEHWGSISKSNSIWLRWRDPIYASPRELAMSYFHEYVKGNKKTLRRVSKPFDIGKYDPDYWVTSEDNCWPMALEIDAATHFSIIEPSKALKLKPRDQFETEANFLKEYAKTKR